MANIMLAIAIALMVGFQIGQRWWMPNGVRFPMLHIVLAICIVALGLLSQARVSTEGSARLARMTKMAPPMFIVIMAIIWFAYFYPLGDFEIYDREGFATKPDMIIAAFMLTGVFYLAWKAFGPLFPIIGLVAVLYGFFAADIPGKFQGPPIPAGRVMSRYVLNSQWSGLVGLFANFVWLVMFWGMLLEVAGARRLVTRLASALGARFATGPGLVAVATSGVVGSFTGGGASDVAITGPITIPLMRRAGYTGAQAAAVEAAASTAAAVTPPILGAVAFVMADRLGVSYRDILSMTLIPALLWYTTLVAYVVASSKRRSVLNAINGGSTPGGTGATAYVPPKDSTYTLWASAITVVLPLATILILVLNETVLFTAVFRAFLVLVFLSVVLRAERDWSVWWRGVVRAATFASSVSVVIITVNIISDTIFFTGLGSRMGDIVYDLSNGRLLLAAILMLIFGIFLSAGMPTLIIYFIMVFTFQPVLIEFDVPVEATHFVAFYMGALNQLIMPVAASVLVAAGIAQVRYWDAGVEASKLILPLVLLPFLFIFAPQLLVGVEGNPALPATELMVVSLFISFIVINMGMGGWLGRPLSMPLRLVLLVVGLMPFLGIYHELEVVIWSGLALGTAALITGIGFSKFSKPAVGVQGT
jgi:TRAP transporter 4TM/12TM fusion protein